MTSRQDHGEARATDPFPLPVLMYHDLAERPADVPAEHRPYVVEVRRFREQLRILSEAGLSGTRLDARLDASADPTRPCVITFDDGHESNCSEALPLLKEAGFSATFFVTAGWVGRAPYMSWKQLRDLAAAGMEIGSHSMTHRPPAALTPAQLRSEMVDSRKLLEDRLGVSVLTASSPTGFFNPDMIPVVEEAGYRGLCIGRIALWKTPAERFRIPRLPIKLSTSDAAFLRLVLGHPGFLAWVRGKQLARDGLKAALGVEGYSRLRRRLLRLAPSRHRESR